MELVIPPPIRRIVVEEEPTVAAPPEAARAHGNGKTALLGRPNGLGPRPQRSQALGKERMLIDRWTVAYGGKVAVSSVSLPVRQGEVLALIGPSGCGKTTLLRSLNRLTELTRGASMKGRIALDGGDIMGLDPTTLRRRVTMVFQQPNPFPMSVFDNVAYVLREQAARRARKKTLEPAVHSALDRAGLFEEVNDNLDHPALKLSGGQQQRLCIARALAA